MKTTREQFQEKFIQGMHLSNYSHSGLLVICGSTATGKSGLAIALAQKLGSALLSADSRQVYREFNIGTAKPTAAQQQLVPHYLIDICSPTETLTVADYQQQAQALISQFHQPHSWKDAKFHVSTPLPSPHLPISPSSHLTPLCSTEGTSARKWLPISPSSPPPILVGGTGLYIRSIVKGLKIPRVEPQQELRSQLQSLGQTQLYAMLQQVDLVAAQKIHPNDPVRTLRALEVFYVTGRTISFQQGENPPNYPILQIGLDCADPAVLTRRIEQRTEQMVADGWVSEVEFLCQKYGSDLPLLDTLGYREMKQYLAGKISLAQAKELTVLHTRQFAKRQRTWFRADPQIEWFDAEQPDLPQQVWQRVEGFLRECGMGNGEWGNRGNRE